MRAVVLGDGLLGLPVTRALADGGHWIRPMSRFNLDLRDPVSEDAFAGADLVVNTMAMTDVDGCEDKADEARRVNADAAGEVARAAAAAGARLVHVSTDYVLQPLGVYAKTKLEGERAVLKAKKDALVVRCSTTFGPHPLRRDFVRWVLGELRTKGEATVAGDMFSCPTYSLEAARFIAEAAERAVTGTFHVANSRGVSRWELANAAQRAFGVPGAVRRGSMKDVAWKAPRAADTRMPQDLPDWFVPLTLEACLGDYAERERTESAAKEGMRE
ncbi:MAG TPA: sugar nucleotide-binding protein [Candidatus Thermoplasmatota archaeon]|nr:sugar nucleotide-binding protein [Candidatus Thermoplasmatota archaeon]